MKGFLLGTPYVCNRKSLCFYIGEKGMKISILTENTVYKRGFIVAEAGRGSNG